MISYDPSIVIDEVWALFAVDLLSVLSLISGVTRMLVVFSMVHVIIRRGNVK